MAGMTIHVIDATIFFAFTDPRDLINWDNYGHGSLSRKAIEVLIDIEKKRK